MNALTLHQATKRFGAFTALDQVSLEVPKGEVTVVIGPSGSGKSTLLRCIAGLEKLDSGTLTPAGAVGIVFQNFHLFPHLSVLDNVCLAPTKVAGVSREEATTRAKKLLERFRVLDQADKLPAQLSGGQQQRVAIVRALAMEPALMLFDEPTSALDPEAVLDVHDAIQDLAAQGMTLFVVSHHMSFARQIAGRVVFMEKGRVLEVAPPKQLFENPKETRTREFLRRVARFDS